MRMTRVYMLIGDGWIYPGRSVDPSKRLLEHLAGKCKTTAPRIAADKAQPIMVPMGQYDFDLDDAPEPNGELTLLLEMLDGEHAPKGYEVLRGVYPYYSKDAIDKSHETNRRNGTGIHTPGASSKGRATQRKSATSVFFNPRLRAEAARRGRESQRKNGTGLFDPEIQARVKEAQRRNGTGVFDPVVRAKGHIASNTREARAKAADTMRKNGTGLLCLAALARGRATMLENGTGLFDPDVRAKAVARAVRTNRNNGTGLFDPDIRAKGLETNRKLGFPNKKHLAMGRHTRWHTSRGIINSECALCTTEENSDA